MIDVKVERRRAQDAMLALDECRQKLHAAEASAFTLRAIVRERGDEVKAARAALAETEARASTLQAVLAEREAHGSAVLTVSACLAGSLRRWGFDRRKFVRLVQQAARSVPNEGPEAVKHRVMLSEARKVLGVEE